MENVYAGLTLAQDLSQIEKGNVKTLIAWMRAVTRNRSVRLGSEIHTALLEAPKIVEINILSHQQEYFRALFAACLFDTDTDRHNTHHHNQ